MKCICKENWNGYHLPTCPCQAAYDRIHQAEVEACLTTPEEAEKIAATLVSEGWVQQSRKYKRVVRIPRYGDALAQLERMAPDKAELIRQRAQEYAEREALNELYFYGETQELDTRTFDAFRAARRAAGEVIP